MRRITTEELNLTIPKIRKLYREAQNIEGVNGCCWRCGRKATIIYFTEDGVVGFACGYHPIEEQPKKVSREVENSKGVVK